MKSKSLESCYSCCYCSSSSSRCCCSSSTSILILLLYSYATSAGMVSTGGGHSPYISTTLPQGNKSEDYNIIIRVDIFDQKGASQVDILNVKVSFLKLS